ncbi:MAG: FAD/NAD(P)-binding protein [Polyangiaceae bacterium]
MPVAAPSVTGSMVPRLLRVARVVRELPDTVTLHLDADPAGGFRFAPGQFNMLYLFGAGEVPISISGDPASPGLLVHTIRAVGAVTRPLCDLKRGGTLGVRGPFGTSWPVEGALGRDILFVAGGLGLAPLRPAIAHVLTHRADYGRVTVLYGARTPEDILFRKDLTRWRGRLDCEVEVTVDRAGDGFRGHVGFVTALVERAELDPQRTVAMLCGPEVMMRFTARTLLARAVPPSAIFLSVERSMKCGAGLCGHCQLGPAFACKDGPVLPWSRLSPLLAVPEL